MNKLNLTFVALALCCLAFQVSADNSFEVNELGLGDESIAEFGNAIDKSVEVEEAFPIIENNTDMMEGDDEDMDEKAVGGRRKNKGGKRKAGKRKSAKKAKKAKKGKKPARKTKKAKKSKKSARKAGKKGGNRKPARKAGKKGGKRRN